MENVQNVHIAVNILAELGKEMKTHIGKNAKFVQQRFLIQEQHI